MSFYNDVEHWKPPNNIYPTWDDVCRFVQSRTSHKSKPRLTTTQATYQMATFVHDVWTAGDGCPMSVIGISKKFTEKVRPIFERYKKGDIIDKKQPQKEKC